MKKVLLIDGSSLFFRAFYALPLLTTKNGLYTNAVYGFISMMENFKESYQPDYLAVCFDQKGKTFRHKEYEDYKGTRQKTPSELDQQWPMVREILDHMHIVTLDSPIYEADDIAGTLGKMASDQDYQVVYLTGDRDYLQLVDENSSVHLTKRGISETEKYDLARLEEEYQLTPDQMIDLKGLMGDSSDNIPGIPGIGEKTGLKLLHQYGTMDGLYAHEEELKGKMGEKIRDYKAQAYMSKKLGTIYRQVPLDLSLEDLAIGEYDYDALRDLYSKYEFSSLLKKLPQDYQGMAGEDQAQDMGYLVLDGAEVLAKCKGKDFAFYILQEGPVYHGYKPHLFAFKLAEDKTYILKEALDQNQLRTLFSGANKKYTYGLKEACTYLLNQEVEAENLVFDPEIAQYLIDPGQNDYSMPRLYQDYFNEQMASLEDLQGKGKKKKSFQDLDQEDLYQYASLTCQGILRLMEPQRKQLEESNMLGLFQEIELPLCEVLASMELTGVQVDAQVLKEINEEISTEIDSLEASIKKEAGVDFNLNSPKQLGQVLFEKMGMPVIKKTKTGYSTSVEVLEKLKGQGPIIDDILRYRSLSKLKSTYLESLADLIGEDGRIHSTFKQTNTATGRISSNDPNLQNIPVRTKEGRLIRKAFVAPEGSCFVDADYSQIELRILAHISKDHHMLDAFRQGQDIHRRTAAQVFHKDQEEITDLERRQAKAVNFGIVYGISDYGLSRDLNIPRKEAKDYIDRYLDNFSGVQKFMKDIIALGKKQGYVETIFHRRRYVPELSAKNFNIRSFGERIALNTPIQGSAADIIKIAMIKVYRALKDSKSQAKLILQIHDELLLEVKEEDRDKVKKELVDLMEGAAKLEIPLSVDVSSGKSWYEAK